VADAAECLGPLGYLPSPATLDAWNKEPMQPKTQAEMGGAVLRSWERRKAWARWAVFQDRASQGQPNG